MGRPALSRVCALAFAVCAWLAPEVHAAEAPLPVQRPLAEGTVDWTTGRVEAQGVASPRSISPHTDWIEGDLRKQADERSLTNLRETLAAVPFDTARTAGDLLADSQLKALAGQAKESFRETLTDGTALRRVWLPLDLLRMALGGSHKAAPDAAAAVDGVVLVVEARGAGLNPAFRMRVLDAAETAIWHGEAQYVSQRPRSLRRAPLMKVAAVRGVHSTDAVLDKRSHELIHKLDKPITAVWVVTDSWKKP